MGIFKSIENELEEHKIKSDKQKHVYLYLNNNGASNYSDVVNYLKGVGFKSPQPYSVIRSFKNKGIVEVVSRGKYKLIKKNNIMDELLYDLKGLLGLYDSNNQYYTRVYEIYKEYSRESIPNYNQPPIKTETQQNVVDYIKGKGNVLVYEIRNNVFKGSKDTKLSGVIRDLHVNNRIQRGTANNINLIENTEISIETYIYNILRIHDKGLCFKRTKDDKVIDLSNEFHNIYMELIGIINKDKLDKMDEKESRNMKGQTKDVRETITQKLYDFMQNKDEYTRDEVSRYVKSIKGKNYQEYVAINGLRVNNKLKRVKVGVYTTTPHKGIYKRLKGRIEFLLSDYETTRGDIKDDKYGELFNNVSQLIDNRRTFDNITEDRPSEETLKIYEEFKKEKELTFDGVSEKVIENGGDYGTTPNHLRTLNLKNYIRYTNKKYRIMEKRTDYLKDDIQEILESENKGLYEIYKEDESQEFIQLYGTLKELIDR